MSRLVVSALLASVAAGIPDVFAAALLSRSSPGKILQTIASGVLGEASYMGGGTSIAFGLGLQIAMSFVIAIVYNMAFLQVESVRNYPFTAAALYGVVIFVVMNFVVVPLSRAHPQPQWNLVSVVVMLIVMILFAEIIALIATALVDRV